jgi:hypothetical protein
MGMYLLAALALIAWWIGMFNAFWVVLVIVAAGFFCLWLKDHLVVKLNG